MHPFSPRILTAIVCEGHVLLNYQLGLADGITLFSRRGPETEFSVFAEDETGPVHDLRPKLDPLQPETRRYRAILRYSSDENRQLSNEIVIVIP